MQKDLNDKYVYAGFFPRFFSYITDLIIVNIISAFVRVPIWFVMIASTDSIFSSKILFRYTIYDIMIYACFCIYFIVMEYFTGTTVGKKMMNLRIISTDESEKASFFDIFYRETIGRFLSSILCVGYICIFATKEKKAIHDMLSDTRVVYGGKIKPVKNILSENKKNNAMPVNNNIQYGVYGNGSIVGTANMQNKAAINNNVNMQNGAMLQSRINQQNMQKASFVPNVTDQKHTDVTMNTANVQNIPVVTNAENIEKNGSASRNVNTGTVSGKDPFGNSDVLNYDQFSSSGENRP